jgi:hypothetical protein
MGFLPEIALQVAAKIALLKCDFSLKFSILLIFLFLLDIFLSIQHILEIQYPFEKKNEYVTNQKLNYVENIRKLQHLLSFIN